MDRELELGFFPGRVRERAGEGGGKRTAGHGDLLSFREQVDVGRAAWEDQLRHGASEEEREREGLTGMAQRQHFDLFLFSFLICKTAGLSHLKEQFKPFQKLRKNSNRLHLTLRCSTRIGEANKNVLHHSCS